MKILFSFQKKAHIYFNIKEIESRIIPEKGTFLFD